MAQTHFWTVKESCQWNLKKNLIWIPKIFEKPARPYFYFTFILFFIFHLIFTPYTP